MPFDGMFLHKTLEELEPVTGARVEKIGQPGRDSLVLHLRRERKTGRLLMTLGSRPRVHWSTLSMEYPAEPPPFCRLLRKHLRNGLLTGIEQKGLDRVLTLTFHATSEIGDPTVFFLVLELMGKQGNCVLVGEDGKVVDALHRVDFVTSGDRPVLAGLRYEAPAVRGEENLLRTDPGELLPRILEKRTRLSDALTRTLEGLSPASARRLIRGIGPAGDPWTEDLGTGERRVLLRRLEDLRGALLPGGGAPILCPGEKPDFTFFAAAPGEKICPGYSALLEDVYRVREIRESVRRTGEPLRRRVRTLQDRLNRKKAVRLLEREKCGDRNRLRFYGDLLSANLFRLEKGMTALSCGDYTAGKEPFPLISVPLDPRLSPSGNVQKYYRDYRKAANAEKILSGLLEECEEEIAYMDSVAESIDRATTEAELLAIRDELLKEGYLRDGGARTKQANRRGKGNLPPLRYRSSDGYRILAGRNNVQNDRLTLKTAGPRDIWFHIRKAPGSHVLLLTEGRALEEIPDTAVEEAAMLAAVNSSGRNSTRVAVDYTPVRNVKKPGGAKPGMVVYGRHYSLITTPDPAKAEALRDP